MNQKLKIIISLFSILALIFTGSVAAKSQSTFQPSLKNLKVTQQDIASFKEYSQQHSDEIAVLNNRTEIDRIKSRLTENKEFLSFHKLQNSTILTSNSQIVFAGKSLSIHNVYLVHFQVSSSYSLLATYDFDRDILMDAFIVDASDKDNTTIVSRNIGTIVKAKLEDLVTLKSGTPKDKELIKEKYKKYDRIGNSNESFSFTSLIATPSANAAGPCGVVDSGTTCSWIAVPVCAALGLIGFLPGLICSASYTYVCSKCSP
ncbi:hypothetical protein [Paenibacillus sp. SYP-B4298]|uniref:hypothetical protein n=1 Tax=Paenibacillus sp. SYP-B4298 TaxID=2996034 RepID=UPI0022DE1AFF|nr:hypothetical protein [Paenibacillus sp. SYP-B4298]